MPLTIYPECIGVILTQTSCLYMNKFTRVNQPAGNMHRYLMNEDIAPTHHWQCLMGPDKFRRIVMSARN